MTFLGEIPPATVLREPFPHVLAHGLLPDELCRQLAREFPPLESFVRGRNLPSNFKIRRPASHLLADQGLSPLWRQVIQDHLLPEVVRDAMRLFGEDVRREHPGLELQFGPVTSWRIGRRGFDQYSDHDILLEAQLVVHTPVVGQPCFERGPHVKRSNKLFELQLFLPFEDEAANGTEIELFAVRPGFQPLFGAGGQTRHEYLRPANWLPYRPNTLCLVLNTPRSIMQIGLRGPSPYPIRYLGVLVEYSRSLFELPAATSSLNPSRESKSAASKRAFFWKGLMNRLSLRAAG